MSKRGRIFFLFVLLVVVFAAVFAFSFPGSVNFLTGAATTDVSSCGFITESGEKDLVNDVSSDGTCFSIVSSDVVLDCNGNTVRYAEKDNGEGVRVEDNDGGGLSNVTVRDCDIVSGNEGNSSNYGVYFVQVNSSIIRNNSIVSDGLSRNYGVYLDQNTSNVDVLNNDVVTNGDKSNYGVFLQTGVFNNTIRSNNILTNGSSLNFGIHLSQAFSNFLVDNDIFTSGQDSNHGVLLGVSDGNIINDTSITTKGSVSHGILVQGSENTTINNVSVNLTHSSSGEYKSESLGLSDSKGNIVNDMNAVRTNTSFNLRGYHFFVQSVISDDVSVGKPDGQVSISKFFNVTSTELDDSWLFLNVSYSDTNTDYVVDSTLRWWMYNHSGGSWMKEGFYQSPSLPTNELVNHWPGDRNTTDVVGGDDAVLKDGASFGISEFDYAFNFDGVDDSVRITGEDTTDSETPFSISLWINPETLSNNDRLITRDCNEWWCLVGDGSSSLVWRMNGGSSISFDVPVREWTHIVVLWNGSESKVYKDGELKGSASLDSFNGGNNRDLCLGENTEGNCDRGTSNFEGLMDELKIYDKALNSSEIQKLSERSNSQVNTLTDRLSVNITEFTSLLGGFGRKSELILNMNKNGSERIIQGEKLNYDILISNSGTVDMKDVTVKEFYPANASYVSSDPNPDENNDFWSLGNISSGDKEKINVVLDTDNSTVGVLNNKINISWINITGDRETKILNYSSKVIGCGSTIKKDIVLDRDLFSKSNNTCLKLEDDLTVNVSSSSVKLKGKNEGVGIETVGENITIEGLTISNFSTGIKINDDTRFKDISLIGLDKGVLSKNISDSDFTDLSIYQTLNPVQIKNSSNIKIENSSIVNFDNYNLLVNNSSNITLKNNFLSAISISSDSNLLNTKLNDNLYTNVENNKILTRSKDVNSTGISINDHKGLINDNLVKVDSYKECSLNKSNLKYCWPSNTERIDIIGNKIVDFSNPSENIPDNIDIVPGKTGYAFNRTSHYSGIYLGDLWTNTSKSVTFMFWFKEEDSNNGGRILSQDCSEWYCIQSYDNGKSIGLNAGNLEKTSINKSVWNHLTLTYNSSSSNLTLYINGEKRIIKPIGNGYAQPTALGGMENRELRETEWRGLIDSFQFFNTSLSSNEIKNIYQKQDNISLRLTGKDIGLNIEGNNNIIKNNNVLLESYNSKVVNINGLNNTLNENRWYLRKGSGFGVYVKDRNKLVNDEIITSSQGKDYKSITGSGVIAKNITLSNKETVSFEDKGVVIDGSITESDVPSRPSGQRSIGRFFNVSTLTDNSWVFINLSYIRGQDVLESEEPSLRLWMYNNSLGEWMNNSFYNPSQYGVNTEDEVVFANITSSASPVGAFHKFVSEINSCGVINNEGVYDLNNSLKSSDDCLIINSSSVTIKGHNKSINGSKEGVGIKSKNENNISIYNLKVFNFEEGIKFNNNTEGEIVNITSNNNIKKGIQAGVTSYNISNINASGMNLDNNQYGLKVKGDNNLIDNAYLNNNGRTWSGQMFSLHVKGEKNKLINSHIDGGIYKGSAIGFYSNHSIINNTYIRDTDRGGSFFEGINQTIENITLFERIHLFLNNSTLKDIQGNDRLSFRKSNNLLVENTRNLGIRLSNSHSNKFNNNSFYDNSRRLGIGNSQNNTFTNLKSSNAGGIRIKNSKNNVFKNILLNSTHGNNLWGRRAAFKLTDSINTTLQNSVIDDADRGLFLISTYNFSMDNVSLKDNVMDMAIEGQKLNHYKHNISESNTIDESPIYYKLDDSDTIISSSDNPGYIGFVNSKNITVKDINISGMGEGILFMNTSNSVVNNSEFKLNHYGVLSHGHNNTFTNVRAIESNNIGLKINGSDNIIKNSESSKHRDFNIDDYRGSNNGLYVSGNNNIGDNLTLYRNYRNVLLSGKNNKFNTINIYQDDVNNNIGYGIKVNEGSNNHFSDVSMANYSYGKSIIFSENTVNNILNNSVLNNGYGSDFLVINGNNTIVENTDLIGIGKTNSRSRGWIISGYNNSLIDNTINNMTFGAELYNSRKTNLQNNDFLNNMYGIDIRGNKIKDFDHEISTSNTIDGDPIYYLNDKKNMRISNSDNPGYIGVIDSQNISVSDINLSSNGQGLLFVNSSDSSVNNLNLRNVSGDITKVIKSNNISITNSVFNHNSTYKENKNVPAGLKIESSNNLSIKDNEIVTKNYRGRRGIFFNNVNNSILKNNIYNTTQYTRYNTERSLWLTYSNNNVINGSKIFGGEASITHGSHNTKIDNIQLKKNSAGLNLGDRRGSISNLTLSDSTFLNSTRNNDLNLNYAKNIIIENLSIHNNSGKPSIVGRERHTKNITLLDLYCKGKCGVNFGHPGFDYVPNVDLINSTIINGRHVMFRASSGTIHNNIIKNVSNPGLHIQYTGNITNNTIIDSQSGILADERYNSRTTNSLISNNKVMHSKGSSLNIEAFRNNLVKNNVFVNNSEGIKIRSPSKWDYVMHNKIKDNTLVNISGFDYVRNGTTNVYNNSFKNNTLSKEARVTLNGKGSLTVNSTSIPNSTPEDTLTTGDYLSINEIRDSNASMNITLFYKDRDIFNIDEETLNLWRYNKSGWNKVSRSKLNKSNNHITGFVSGFSTFTGIGDEIRPSINITISDVPDPASQNTTINYTVSVVNNGSDTAYNTTFVIDYPNLNISNITPSADIGDNKWLFNNMKVNEKRTVNFTGYVSPDFSKNEVLTTANLTFANVTGNITVTEKDITRIEDTFSPKVSINNPLNGEGIQENETPVLVNGTATDNIGIDEVELFINGPDPDSSIVSNNSGVWNYTWNPTATGAYSITTYAVDEAGNIGEDTVEVTVTEESEIQNVSTINSIIIDCSITNSYLLNSTCLSSFVNQSSIYDSQTDYSSIDNSTLNKSESNNSTIINSYKENTKMEDSMIVNSTNVNCRLTNTIENNTLCINSTVIDSDISDLKLNNSNITGGFCNEGVIMYNNLTFECPISLNNVRSLCGETANICHDQNSCNTCSIDCGECPEPKTTQSESSSGSGRSYCEQEWTCTEWSSCKPDGVKERTCYDKNSCLQKRQVSETELTISRTPKPSTTQSCDYQPTCTDGIKNGDETSVDCGGSDCPRCNINKTCNEDKDCTTNNCLNNQCQPQNVECINNNQCENNRTCSKNNKCVTDTEERKPTPTEPVETKPSILTNMKEKTQESLQKTYQKTKSLLTKLDNALRALDAWIFNNLEKATDESISALVDGVQSLDKSLNEIIQKVYQTIKEKSDEVIGATILSLIMVVLLITGYYNYKRFKEIEIKNVFDEKITDINNYSKNIIDLLSKFRNKIINPIIYSPIMIKDRIDNIIKKNRAKTTAKELNKFIKESILEEKTKEEIKQKLQDKGWPEDLVNDYVNHFYKENKELIQKIKEK